MNKIEWGDLSEELQNAIIRQSNRIEQLENQVKALEKEYKGKDFLLWSNKNAEQAQGEDMKRTVADVVSDMGYHKDQLAALEMERIKFDREGTEHRAEMMKPRVIPDHPTGYIPQPGDKLEVLSVTDAIAHLSGRVEALEKAQTTTGDEQKIDDFPPAKRCEFLEDRVQKLESAYARIHKDHCHLRRQADELRVGLELARKTKETT